MAGYVSSDANTTNSNIVSSISQAFLIQFNCKYNKIASAMIVHEELPQMVADDGKHTGMRLV